MPVCQRCFCHQGECNCYRFLRDYLSPNVPVTTLVITGNHPATLVANIEYQRAQQAGGDTWSCNIGTGTPDRKCCIYGNGLFTENNVWQDDFCCRQTRSGSLTFENYFCCDRPGQNNDEWKLNYSGSISATQAGAWTTTYGVWYRSLAVRMYAGELNGCCGVWVEACLGFLRLQSVNYKGASYTSACVTHIDSPCVGVIGEDESETTCCGTDSYSADPNYNPQNGGLMNCPEAFDLVIDNDLPLETFFAGNAWFGILRRKFVPGNPECTLRDLPVLSVTLTPADNVPQIVGCAGCFQQANPFCVPTLVYYDRGTYADASEACCGQVDSVTCGSSGVSKTPGLAALLGACHTTCDNVVEFSRGAAALGVNAVYDCDVNGIANTSQPDWWVGALSNCYSGSGPTVTEITSRTNTITDSCTIPTCDYLLFGEIDDTWTLTISLPN